MPSPINRASPSLPPTAPARPAATTQPAAAPATQSWTPRASGAAKAAPVAQSPIADGAFAVPFSLELGGRRVDAKLAGTVVSYSSMSDRTGVEKHAITVQELTDVRVEVGGRRLAIADDALVTLMRQRGVELDFAFSSPTEISEARLLGLVGPRPLVTCDGGTFRMMERSETRRYHAGSVAVQHPDRVY